jgi:hypothetical protein
MMIDIKHIGINLKMIASLWRKHFFKYLSYSYKPKFFERINKIIISLLYLNLTLKLALIYLNTKTWFPLINFPNNSISHLNKLPSPPEDRSSITFAREIPTFLQKLGTGPTNRKFAISSSSNTFKPSYK